MSFIHSLTDNYTRRRFAFLFVSLLTTMLAAPVLGAKGVSTRFLEVFLALNILGAVLVTLFRIQTYLGIGLLTLVFVTWVGNALLGYGPLLATSQGIGAVICFLSTCVMLRNVLREGSVTSERIFAALNVYLMFGIMCGLLYCVLEEQWAGSFLFQGSSLVGAKENVMAHTIYFSFVTLGTLGYGDITPVGGPARALAVAEAIGGQLYLVVIVARLVSLYTEGSGRQDPAGRYQKPDQDNLS